MAAQRRELGLTNITIMIPFCRTVEEGKRVIAAMATLGLDRDENCSSTRCAS